MAQRKMADERNAAAELLRAKARNQADMVKDDRCHWTKKELYIVKEFYTTLPNHKLIEQLPGRPWHAIRMKADRLGLKRSMFNIDTQ